MTPYVVVATREVLVNPHDHFGDTRTEMRIYGPYGKAEAEHRRDLWDTPETPWHYNVMELNP